MLWWRPRSMNPRRPLNPGGVEQTTPSITKGCLMHYNRLQKANVIAKKLFKKYHGVFPEDLSSEERECYHPSVESHLGTYRKVRKPCSAHCCGNPRKYYNDKTYQEKKADEDFKQQIDDLEEVNNNG